MRSSVVPQTIASDTAQKTNWKNHSVSTVIVPSCSEISGKLAPASSPARKNPLVPMIALPSPNAKAKPTAQNINAAIEKLTRIFATTVPAFLPREKPISRNAKPACMNITRMPATSTQIELMPTLDGQLPVVGELQGRPISQRGGGRRESDQHACRGRTDPAGSSQRHSSSSFGNHEQESVRRWAEGLWPAVESSPAELRPASGPRQMANGSCGSLSTWTPRARARGHRLRVVQA